MKGFGGRSVPSRAGPSAAAACLAPAWFTLLFLALPPRAAAQHFPPDEDLELMLRYLVEDSLAPGVVLGVLEEDGTRRIVHYGSAGEGARPLGPRSTFEIGSVTKTFTATLLAEMTLRGEVALEDPISKYLPAHVRAPSRAGREVTLLDLATHTSGLPLTGHRPSDPWDPSADFTVEELYAFVDTVELWDIPGHRFNYSNVGMALLGHLLGRAVGSTYADLLRERILEPLDMTATGLGIEGAVAEYIVRGHYRRGVTRYRTPAEAAHGQGGLVSNAEDLLKYLHAHVGPPRTELERAMRMTREVRGTAVEGRYGLGWRILRLGEREIVFHGGGTAGFTTRVAFDPERRIGTVLLANVRRFPDALATALLPPSPPPPEWRRVDVAREVLVRYEGEYRSTSGENRYYVRLEDEGWLTYQPAGAVRARLYATSDTTFYLLRGPWSFTFRPDEAGDGVTLLMAVDEREPTGSGVTQNARKVAGETPRPAVAAGNSWYRPPRGPGGWGLILLLGGAAALVLLALGPLRWRKAAG